MKQRKTVPHEWSSFFGGLAGVALLASGFILTFLTLWEWFI